MPVVLLFFICFTMGAVSLTGQATAWAQEGEPRLADSEHAAQFREDVVDSWNWKPDQGVGLTTTKYALDYVGRYKAKKYGPLARELVGLVLFQTATHDIPVFQWGPDKYFLVIERSSREIVASAAGHRYDENLRFVDVDGEAPPELQRISSGTNATGQWWKWYRVYDLAGGFDTLLEVEGYTDDQRCPDVQPRIKESDKTPNLATNDVAKTPKLRRFRMGAELKLAGCTAIDARPEFTRECRFDDSSRTFECKDSFSETVRLKFEDIESDSAETTAKNVRWVLKNTDELRKHGFRLSDGFLDRLRSYLAEDSDN